MRHVIKKEQCICLVRDSPSDEAASSSDSLDERASACVGHDDRSDHRTTDSPVELLEGPARTGAPAPAWAPTVAWTAYPSDEPSKGRVTDRECDGGAGGMMATAPMAVEMIAGAGCYCCSARWVVHPGWLLLLS